MDTGLYVKAAHIISMVFWMAGLLYLPRLFVYHSGLAVDDKASSLFITMERRLSLGVMMPALAGVWIFGMWLVSIYGGQLFIGFWFSVKLGLVVILTGFHMFLGGVRKRFALGGRPFSAKFFRLINEVPAVIMVLVALLVVVRPF